MGFFSLIRATSKIDIFDINYFITNEKVGTAALSKRKKSWVLHFLRFHWLFLATIYRRQFSSNIKEKGRVFFFAPSVNNRDSLFPVYEKTKNAELIMIRDFGYRKYPMFFAYLISFFYFPVLLYRFFWATKFQRKTFSFCIHEYWIAYGVYFVSRIFLRKKKPVAIVFSNDHSVIPRSVLYAAKHENIITCYVPHASVSYNFPPLLFDFAFLEGKDSMEKYITIGKTNATIFLTGSPKTDKYLKYQNTSSQIRSIGICSNLPDSIELVFSLAEMLRKCYPELTIVLRPHPGDKRGDKIANFAEKHGFLFSNAREEISFNFFQKVDAIIAGNSNITLEAASLNVYPLYYNFGHKFHTDPYGFVASGLVTKLIENQDEMKDVLASIIFSKPDVSQKAAYYYANIGTPYQGQSSAIVGELVDCFSKNLSIPDKWVKHDKYPNVYTLR